MTGHCLSGRRQLLVRATVYRTWYNDSTIGLTVSLANPGLNTGVAAGDTYANIEALGGTNFADTLFGDGGNNTLSGIDGDDTLIGGAGGDFLIGGNGVDVASYATAAAGVTASLFNPGSNTGDAAGDFYSSIERLTGSNFDDTLTGDNANNLMSRY